MKFLKKNRFGDHSDFYIYNKKKIVVVLLLNEM